MAGLSNKCGWCKTYSNMDAINHRILSTTGTNSRALISRQQFTCACDHCGALSILTRYGHVDSPGDIIQTAIHEEWIPTNAEGRTFEDVPELIASVASEAYKCASVHAYRGAVALARAVVEATAKEKGITSNGIASKIENLHTKGFIREHVKEAAHEVRFGGNEVAHGDLAEDDLDDEEAEEILALMSEILLEVFQSPARVERQRQKRIARKAANQAAEAKSASPASDAGAS